MQTHLADFIKDTPEGLMRLHRRLKDVFDPQRVFNPGRLYREL